MKDKILQFIKSNSKKLIAGVVIILVLVFAFWYGNGTKESRGFSVQNQQEEMGQTSEQTTKENVTQNKVQEGTKAEAEEEKTETDEAQEQGNIQGTDSIVSDSGTSDNGISSERTESDSEDVQPNGNNTENGNQSSDLEQIMTCTLSISCASVLEEDNWNHLATNKKEIIPSDGWMMKPVTVTFTEGESAYEVLRREADRQNVLIDAAFTPAYQTYYVNGIGNLYEKDCGGGSGWTYYINNEWARVGISAYQLRDGDVIEMKYSCKPQVN